MGNPFDEFPKKDWHTVRDIDGFGHRREHYNALSIDLWVKKWKPIILEALGQGSRETQTK